MLMWIVTGVVAAQAVGLCLLWRRVAACDAAKARVDRMGEAIAMLSETAEAGFAAVAQELDKQRRAPVVRPTATRATIARRVVKAASAGESVEAIARRELMSEGEVRLHLALAESTRSLVAARPAIAVEPVETVEPVVSPAPAPAPVPRPKATRAAAKVTPATPEVSMPAVRQPANRKGARRATVRA